MSTSLRHYPHAIEFNTTELAVIDNVNVSRGYENFAVMPASAPGPVYTGVGVSSPAFSMSTRNPKILFDILGDEDLVADLDAVNVDLLYRAGKPAGIRDAIGNATHYKARMTSCGMLWWDSLDVQAKQLATVDFQLRAAALTGQSTAFVWSGPETTDIAEQSGDVYTLGKVYVSGVQVSGVRSVRIDNNVQWRGDYSDDDLIPSYQEIESYAPVVTIDFNLLSHAAGEAFGGSQASSWAVYLQKRTRSGIVVSGASAEHIEILGGTAHYALESVSDNPAVARMTLRAERASNIFYAIDTAHAVP